MLLQIGLGKYGNGLSSFIILPAQLHVSTEENGFVKHYVRIYHLIFDWAYFIGFISAGKRIRVTGDANTSDI